MRTINAKTVRVFHLLVKCVLDPSASNWRLCNYFLRYLLRSRELLEATEILKMRSLHESLL